jgi:murein DD-endopeptidase MepM/ murein hydrolase activator NlpD
MFLRRHPTEYFAAARVSRGALSCVAAVAALMAGCSADIRRLEQPTYALGEKPPLPPQPIGSRRGADTAGWPSSGPAAKPGVERVATLPDTVQPVNPSINPSVPFDAPKKPKPVAANSTPTSAPIVAGQTIDVQPGDSLYAISKRHSVSIAALMDLNGLKSAALRPGQKITLPANARRPVAKPAVVTPSTAVGQAPAASPAPVAAAPAPAAAAAPVVAAPAPADWNGSYTVKAGDSLYGIARANKVQVADLQRFNGISDPSKMRPGMNLKVPAGAAAAAAPASAAAPVAAAPVQPAPPVAAAPAPATEAPRANASGGPRLLNPPASAGGATAAAPASAPATKVAAVGPVALPAPATATGAATKFRWPAKGTTLAGFGKRPDGAHNDGINISVPAGTDITAADGGTIAYAGSEIKAYGNLVLIRHEGGWVTAYAHADQILVKRGDTVTRGQVIAKAGATGSVDQPQVHFELRQGSKPVDPAPHMEK